METEQLNVEDSSLARKAIKLTKIHTDISRNGKRKREGQKQRRKEPPSGTQGLPK